MKFRRAKATTLKALAGVDGTYPGASNLGYERFKNYIRTKRLKGAGGSVHAQDAYGICYYRPTENAMAAEDALLKRCVRGSCPYNVHRRSNVSDGPGYVYVLCD